MTNENTTKFCTGCQKWHLKGHFNKDNKAEDGLCFRCKACRNRYRRQQEVRDRTALYNKKYADRNPELMRAKDRKNSLKRFWGMKVEEYEALLAAQGGTCGICPRTESNPHKRLCIDHDHDTGGIRGLLCDHHNRALGLLNDSISELEAAIKYLKSHRS